MITSLPAPVKGWNTRDALAMMKPEHAIVLDNFFPANEQIELRHGFTSHATGLDGAVESLMEYVPATGTGVLFGASNDDIRNVTSSGAVGAAVVSGLTNARFQHVNMGTSGGRFLFICNGADTPRVYDGSSWSNTTLTGPTTANLIWCALHQRRMWVGEINSLSAWYGGTNAITGAFTEFPLYGIARKGGYIMGMATWTRDGGAGMDDVAVFVTSEGEAIVYSGTNPASADTWSLIGVFEIGRPLGRRFQVKAGADVVLLLEDGFVPLSRVLVTDRAQVAAHAVSDQISPTFAASARDYGSNFGWQPILYPKRNQVLVNVPISTTEAHQYVFNTLTGAPCRFKGMNAACWGMLGDDLYFGAQAGGVVYQADDGLDDNNADIAADVMQAYSYFGSPGGLKQFKLARPVYSASTSLSLALDFNVDFAQRAPTNLPSTVLGSSPVWDTAKWDEANWGGDDDIYARWHSISGVGRAGSLRQRLSSQGLTAALLSTDIAFERGAGL